MGSLVLELLLGAIDGQHVKGDSLEMEGVLILDSSRDVEGVEEREIGIGWWVGWIGMVFGLLVVVESFVKSHWILFANNSSDGDLIPR